jgi:hypothetical protein
MADGTNVATVDQWTKSSAHVGLIGRQPTFIDHLHRSRATAHGFPLVSPERPIDVFTFRQLDL